MTHLCAAILVTDLEQVRRDAASAAGAGADMVELRIDQCTDPERIRDILCACSLPAIVTCRPTWEGGRCQLPEDTRLALLCQAAHAGATYIDIELAAFQGLTATGDRLAPERVILSAHDFSGRVPDLDGLLQRMRQLPAAVRKIAWSPRSIRDNLQAFRILKDSQAPTVALCMGEAGLISRVLCRKFGAFLTYAAVDGQEGTAPGQIGISELRKLYRWDAIGRGTKVYGVVACPVRHSLSPAVHNAAFDAVRYDGVYLPLLVEPDYESFRSFLDEFAGFEDLSLCGVSVTIPHKQNALRYLREKNACVDPLAASIGAVNTIIIERRGGSIRLQGTNTDYAAILDSITEKLGIRREDLAGFRVAVLGAGGTGRTAVAALAHYGVNVLVCNRTRERAEALAAEFDGRRGRVVAAPLAQACRGDFQILINTTSVGMYPAVDASPLDPERPKLRPDSLVFDSVYNPMRTKLLSQAEEQGARTISGVEMFLRQAAAQFEAWTGLPAPLMVMRRAIEDRLVP